MKIRTILIVIALALVGSLVLVLNRPEPAATPEAAIERVLDEMVSAARSKDLGGLLDHVSDRFKGQGMDRDQLKGLLFVQLRQGRWTGVLLRNTEISLEGSAHANVRTEALLARGDALLPDNADSLSIELAFELDPDSEWRLIGGRWQR